MDYLDLKCLRQEKEEIDSLLVKELHKWDRRAKNIIKIMIGKNIGISHHKVGYECTHINNTATYKSIDFTKLDEKPIVVIETSDKFIYRIRLDDFVSDNYEARIKEIITNVIKERDLRIIKQEIRY